MLQEQQKSPWTILAIVKDPSTDVMRPASSFSIQLQHIPETVKLSFESSYTKEKSEAQGAVSPSIQFKENKILRLSFTAILRDTSQPFLSASDSYDLLLRSMTPVAEITQTTINTGSPPILLLTGPMIPIPFFTQASRARLRFISDYTTPVVLTKISAKLSEFMDAPPLIAQFPLAPAPPELQVFAPVNLRADQKGIPKHIEVDLDFFVVVFPEEKRDMNLPPPAPSSSARQYTRSGLRVLRRAPTPPGN